MNKTVRVTCSEKIDGEINSASMVEKLKNTVDKLKDLPEKQIPDVRIHMKRGPKT